MLSIALLHIIISLICLFAGMLLHILFKNSRNEAIVVYFISGLIAITCMGQIAALFTAVGPFLQLTIASLLLLAAFLKRNALVAILKRLKNESLPASRMELISFLSLWVLLIVYASGPTQMDDTESYHIQMVKWLKEYGTVPGLANLHERFGFNSSWFTSIALFAPTSRQVNYYVILNSLISVWFVFYLLRIIFKTNSGRPSLQIAATCILGIALISFPILRGNAATANYDSITCLLILVLFGETWQKGDSFHNWQPGPEWLLWPAYLFTIRVTNMPFTLLLVPALYIFLKRSKRRQIGFFIFFYLLLWVPFQSG